MQKPPKVCPKCEAKDRWDGPKYAPALPGIKERMLWKCECGYVIDLPCADAT